MHCPPHAGSQRLLSPSIKTAATGPGPYKWQEARCSADSILSMPIRCSEPHCKNFSISFTLSTYVFPCLVTISYPVDAIRSRSVGRRR
jgi:hypothetical protein